MRTTSKSARNFPHMFAPVVCGLQMDYMFDKDLLIPESSTVLTETVGMPRRGDVIGLSLMLTGPDLDAL